MPDSLVENTPTCTPDSDLASEPEPAGSAPSGTGNDDGQFGGSWPSRERETSPSGTLTEKLLGTVPLEDLAVVVVAALESDELEQAVDTAPRPRAVTTVMPATRVRERAMGNPPGGTGARRPYARDRGAVVTPGG